MIHDLISIIIPVFNRENYIHQALSSVEEQTYSNWECLIIDDGSNDKSIEIAKSYSNSNSKFKFHQRNRVPKGASTSRNIGLRFAKGKYIIFLDSDDMLAEYCLRERAKIISLYPLFDFWVFKTMHFKFVKGDSNSLWNELHKEEHDLIRLLAHDTPWQTSGVIWKKQALIELNGFNENALCWQDWELNVRAILKNYSYFKAIDSLPDTYYRRNQQSLENSISGNCHSNLSINSSILLLENFYEKIITQYNTNEFHNALAHAFYDLFIFALEKNQRNNCKKIIRIGKTKKIFTFIELFFLFVLFLETLNPLLNVKKERFLKNCLGRLNPGKFRNDSHNTLIHYQSNHLT